MTSHRISGKASLILLMCLTTIFSNGGCKGEKQPDLPKAVAEQKVALPEYFGFYGVDHGKTIRLPRMEEWRSEQLSSATEFLLFEEGASEKTAKAFMRGLSFAPAISLWQNGQPSLTWDQNAIEKIHGAPNGFKNDSSFGIELLRKPVANQPAMIRLVPNAKLEPGLYTIEFGDTAFVVWIDRDIFDKEISEDTAKVKAALADPRLPQQLTALKTIERLRMARAKQLPPEAQRELAEFGKPEEFEVLLTHPTSVAIKSKKGDFEGMYLFCEHCHKGFKVREALDRTVKQSRVVPCTFYMESITCSQCKQTTSAEFAFVHGL